VSAFRLRLTFHGDLDFFLRSKSTRFVERILSERRSIKDAIESCGVPHTEVDLILINREPVGFSRVLEGDAEIEVYPMVAERCTFFPQNRLQSSNIQQFVADDHLGKLVRDLRLLGLDILYDSAAEDRQLLDLVTASTRALLTHDRRLLMHAVVRHGCYLRSQQPLAQTAEVLRRFDLAGALAPFSRCLRCNAKLAAVEKAEVLGQLEPLTKIYYDDFRRCTACAQVYWRGSHHAKLQARVAELMQQL
jgi:uncharacterized protein